MAVVVLLNERYKANKAPLAVVSWIFAPQRLKNCRNSILTIAKEWYQRLCRRRFCSIPV